MSMNNRHLKTIVRRPLMAAWGVLSLLTVGSASGATTNFFASNLLPPPNGLYMPPAPGVK